MKKIKLLISALLGATMLFGLTACSSEKDTKDTNSNEVGNNTVQESLEDSGEDADDSESMDGEENNEEGDNASIPPATDIMPGMGVENGVFFATPILNGEPVNAAAMDEICLVGDDNDTGVGVSINLAGTGKDYVIAGLDSYNVYLGSGNIEDDEYEQEIEIYMDYMSSYEDDYAELEVYETDGDISYYYEDDSFFAIKKHGDFFMCVSGYSVEEEMLESLKAEIKSIFDNTVFVDDVEPEFSTAYSFDAIAFDCGWYVTDISHAYWYMEELMFVYEEGDSALLFFLEKEDEAEEPEEEDDWGNYCIQMDDGSYLDISVTYVAEETTLDIHDWTEVEKFLNGGN